MKATDLKRIVETTDWDNELIRKESKIDGVLWIIVALAAVYFFIIIFNMFTR